MSHYLYIGFIAAVGIERLFELRLSKKHERIAFAAGGQEYFPRHFVAMSLMHTAFLFACVAEVVLLQRTFNPWIGLPALLLALLAQGLRYWVIATLGSRWNVRIIVVPNFVPVTNGPYRYLRHPNYFGVITEMIVIPLIHGAWITAMVFSALNAMVLFVRIRAEEQALGAGYEEAFKDKHRLLPGPAR